MSEAKATIDALSKEFDRAVIQMKPGSNKRPAMPYVSHGSCTKRLNAVCPDWSSRVVAMHTYMDQQGRMQCAGVTLELTIPGVGSREEFGAASTPRDFGTDAKNAMSDALKRCAMRFGCAIDLWEEMDEDNDPDAQRFDAPQLANKPAPPARTTPPSPSSSRPAAAPSAAAGTPKRTLAEVMREIAPLARQVRLNDEALSGPEYARYHELEAEAQALYTGLRDTILNDEADPKARRMALHHFYDSADTIARLTQRVEAVKKSGLPGDDLDKAYAYHHHRLAEQLAPPASIAG